jgi:hypothetical protein
MNNWSQSLCKPTLSFSSVQPSQVSIDLDLSSSAVRGPSMKRVGFMVDGKRGVDARLGQELT